MNRGENGLRRRAAPLAWVLHAEAQTKRTAGSASTERLRGLVETYLREEGHDDALAQTLFTGMVERVVALVSRVEGTYEFEVQPLREYFAARHLYDTAPYSPPGQERSGTLPDRFDALARDLFWQNVTRFYAGCYSKGQLASLVDRIQELARAPGFKYTSYAHHLAATLLSDWVFAQHPKAMREVAALLLEGVGMRIAAGSRSYRGSEALVLPKQNGNQELVDRCFEVLRAGTAGDYRDMLLDVVEANCSPEEAWDRWWSETSSQRGDARTRWMKYGLRLGLLARLSQGELTELLADSCDEVERLVLVCRGGKAGLVEADDVGSQKVIEYILGGGALSFFPTRKTATLIGTFAVVLNPYIYRVAFEQTGPWPLTETIGRFFGHGDVMKSARTRDARPESEAGSVCGDLVNLAAERWEMSVSEWASQLEPWNDVVEKGRELFGERWTFTILANMGAGIRAKDERCERGSELQDPAVSLGERVRYARLRAGVAKWWEAQLNAASEQSGVAMALLVVLTWGGPSVFSRLSQLIDEKLMFLDDGWWHKLHDGLRACVVGTYRRRITVDFARIGESISERWMVALATRAGDAAVGEAFKARVMSYEGDDGPTLALCQRIAMSRARSARGEWRDWLPVISRTYAKGVAVEPFMGYRFYRAVRSQQPPDGVAKQIVEQGDRYPAELVGWAEGACRQRLAEKVVPVGTIAEKEGWFRS